MATVSIDTLPFFLSHLMDNSLHEIVEVGHFVDMRDYAIHVKFTHRNGYEHWLVGHKFSLDEFVERLMEYALI